MSSVAAEGGPPVTATPMTVEPGSSATTRVSSAPGQEQRRKRTRSTSSSRRKELHRRPSISFAREEHPWATRSWGYQYRPFRGMWNDVKRRAPFYVDDWVEGFRPHNLNRVVAATVRMYFLNLIPALAYIIDMNVRTGGNYGVNEGVLASAIAALAFSIFSVQPLTIVGVTGLINLVNYTQYDIVTVIYDVPYLQFQAWVLIWSAITHFIVAIFNLSDYCRFITDMTSETFGLYVGIIYIQKGIELLVLEFEVDGSAGWLSVVIAILFALVVYFLERVGSLPFGPFWFRKAAADYSFMIAIIFFTGFAHIPGEIKESGIEFLPITRAMHPTLQDRDWVVDFWNLDVKWVFVALPFGCLVTLLFYFDNNVSSLMAQARGFPVKRPAGFHWDFFLLGITTLVAGILGLPAPNGLVPQAPVHTEALCELKMVDESAELSEGGFLVRMPSRQEEKERIAAGGGGAMKVVRTRVVEQRVSHFAMGLLTLGTMSRPLLVVLGLMSRAMFAGVFIVVGWGSVEGSGIVHKTLFLLRDPKVTPSDHPLLAVKKSQIIKYVSIQWLFFAAIIAVSETIAAICFPVIITILIPVRHFWVPRWFTPAELGVLDAPTANSSSTLVSLGGDLEDDDESIAQRSSGKEKDVEHAGAEAAASGLRRRRRTRANSRGPGDDGSDSDEEPQEAGHIQRVMSIQRGH